MEFSPPPGFYPNRFPNYGQPYAVNTPTPFAINGYSELVGEGNVTSLISPDGSTQLLFIPTAQWWSPYLRNPHIGNCNNPYLNNLGPWLIRSVYNPLQPTVFSQPYQTSCGPHLNPVASTSDCCLNMPVPGFAVKFHNDNSTSTSDIHYFYPKQYNWFQKPRECVAIQVEVPRGKVCCAKPCNCAPVHKYRCTTRDKGKQKCICIKPSNSSNSAMSVEESKSDLTCHKKDKGKNSHKLKRTKSKSSYPQCECDHKERKSSDKCVTTFAEQASGCSPEKGRETQTVPQSVCIPVREVNSEDFISMAEIWKPKTPISKKAMTIKSSETSEELCERCRDYSSISETE